MTGVRENRAADMDVLKKRDALEKQRQEQEE
jgi:hypothetical protein